MAIPTKGGINTTPTRFAAIPDTYRGKVWGAINGTPTLEWVTFQETGWVTLPAKGEFAFRSVNSSKESGLLSKAVATFVPID